MSKKAYLLFSFAIFLLIPFFSNFFCLDGEGSQLVRRQFQAGLDDLKDKLETYQVVAQNLDTSFLALEELKKIHLKTRLSFKKIEFLLEYLDHPSIKRHLNGAPLPSLEQKVPEINVLEPLGLQVLDELIFSEDAFTSADQIQALASQMLNDYIDILNYQFNIPINNRQVFESMRMELIRVFTLGLTGFDTPGSVNAIPEAQVAMEAVFEAFQAYRPLIEDKDKALGQNILLSFRSAIEYLDANQDFERFDRLFFLKTHINPLYQLLYLAHKTLGIEFIEEVNTIPQALNYHATNIFANDFLNVGYYTGFDMESDLAKKRIALGKLLFFDPILSVNNKRACASCHQPEKGFTDGLKKSFSIDENEHIKRNAPTIINSVYAEKYFYDLREEFIERQINHVVLDKAEFNTDFFEIVEKLEQSSEYREMFSAAYPTYQISKWPITNALASFVANTKSFNSPFDKYARGEEATISPAAIRGFNLFMGKAACATCHFAPTFSGLVPVDFRESETEVLGVPQNKDTLNPMIDDDPGRFQSGRMRDLVPFYINAFKTPTIRNISLTGPYMHNGVYDQLDEVIDFYNKGGGIGLGLDVAHQTLPDTPLNLTKKEISDLVTFMETLTDTTGMTKRPLKLPLFDKQPDWNNRPIGGDY